MQGLGRGEPVGVGGKPRPDRPHLALEAFAAGDRQVHHHEVLRHGAPRAVRGHDVVAPAHDLPHQRGPRQDLGPHPRAEPVVRIRPGLEDRTGRAGPGPGDGPVRPQNRGRIVAPDPEHIGLIQTLGAVDVARARNPELVGVHEQHQARIGPASHRLDGRGEELEGIGREPLDRLAPDPSACRELVHHRDALRILGVERHEHAPHPDGEVMRDAATEQVRLVGVADHRGDTPSLLTAHPEALSS